MTKTRVIAVMMVLVMVAGFTMGAEKGSETFRASCLVKVSADRSVIQLDNTMTIIEYLVQSSGVAGRARADVLQVPQDDIGECFSILIEPLAVDTTSGARPAATRTRATTSRTPKETSPQMMGGMMMPGMPSGGMGGMGGGLMDIPVPKKPTSTARTRSSSSSSRIGGGMGGYGGGMMGGMGGIGGGMGGYGGGTTTRPATPTRSTGTRPAAGNDDQTLLFKLEVDLTDCDKPVAEEFLAAVVENLENAFLHAYEMRLEQLEMQLHQAMEQHEKMVAAIDKKAGRTEEDKETEEQLETKVDLSELNVDTTLKNAVEMIRKSVDPPLKLIVMWTDLENNAFIQQDTPVGCSGEGLYNVPLRAGLDRVLASVGGGLSDISYSIKDGIVTVATEESTSYYTYVVSDSISGPSRYAPFEYSDAELETLYDQKQSWLKEEYSIQMESARMKARSRAIEKQLPKLRDSVQVQMSNDTVSL
ncbi:MAG: hypothetical protein KAS23_11025, partial [Anaerohalosphaera sp.]|nr:hypothetical protein [Anaerohalosphaera sp.]